MNRRRHALKPPSKASKLAALQALLIQCERLDTIDLASLCRSYGVSERILSELIEAEQLRRVAR